MNDRRQFLASLTAAAGGGWLAGPALAASGPLTGAIPVEAVVHWVVDVGQEVALQAVRRMARTGEPIYALPGPIEPAWVREQFEKALTDKATLAGVATMADTFVLHQLARDSGWCVLATQAASATRAHPALCSWRFKLMAKDSA